MSLFRVKGFRGKTPTLRGPECLGKPPPRNTKSARLAAFDKIGNVFSFTYSQMTTQRFRQLDVYSCFRKFLWIAIFVIIIYIPQLHKTGYHTLDFTDFENFSTQNVK